MALSKSTRMAVTKAELKVFGGMKDGKRVIAAVPNQTEFRRLARLNKWQIDGLSSDLTERAVAMGKPRAVFERGARDFNGDFVERVT